MTPEQRRLESRYDILQLAKQAFTVGRSRVCARGSNQQLVLERCAQTFESSTHGWLTQVAPFSRTSHVLLFEQRVKRFEKIEIERKQMFQSCPHVRPFLLDARLGD